MDPVLKKQLRRFRKHKRGYYSFILLTVLFILSLGSEWIANNKPFIMKFEGQWYFPILKFYPAETFGEAITIEADYRAIRESDRFKNNPKNFMIFPLIPYSPNESIRNLPTPPPTPPSKDFWLGTDDRGRDVLSRLIYGFRNSMLFALAAWILTSMIGYAIGGIQGYIGGRTDLYGQRLIEIWMALPFLYIIIYLRSLLPPTLFLLLIIWTVMNWTTLVPYVRVEVLRIRKMDYVMAAKALGVSTHRVLFRHILRNALTPLFTFSPFIISSNIGALSALDFLGLGLPPPTPSWGELLRQGKADFNSWWLIVYSFLALFFTLLILNFIGEAARTAFDPKEENTTG